jgi:hypothetical protein
VEDKKQGGPFVQERNDMKLTAEQERAVQGGQAVQVSIGGAECVLLRKDVYERGEAVDFSPWTLQEMNLLATETADLLAGDAFDEPDES